MAVITPEIKEFIKNNLGWITTVSKDGELDLGPKMSLFVLDDTHIAYHERTAGQHYENLKNGSPLVIAFANLEKKQGYRFRGNVVLHVDDDIYKRAGQGRRGKGHQEAGRDSGSRSHRDPGPCLRSDRRQDHRQGLIS